MSLMCPWSGPTCWTSTEPHVESDPAVTHSESWRADVLQMSVQGGSTRIRLLTGRVVEPRQRLPGSQPSLW